jgi:hypothetical protein
MKKINKKIIALSLACIFGVTANVTASTYIIKLDDKHNDFIVAQELRNWQETSSIFTAWLDIEAAYDFTGYLPPISNQENNFIQTDSYKQNQTQTEQKREFDDIKSD